MAGQKREARLRANVPAIHVFNSVEFSGVDARNSFAKTRFALLSGHDASYFNGLLTKP